MMKVEMITAVILAAGQSQRMGQPKMCLPWGKTTVLGQVIATYKAAGVEDILVVTGSAQEQVEQIVTHCEVRSAFNPDHVGGEMLSSIQVGIKNLSAMAALIGLGDQPQVQERSVRRIVEKYIRSSASLVVPSYQMRRGHPWLVTKVHWDEILDMKFPQSPREFLNRHADEIHYVEVTDPGILQDLDTPEEYLKSKP